jgi:hypothetical protein
MKKLASRLSTGTPVLVLALAGAACPQDSTGKLTYRDGAMPGDRTMSNPTGPIVGMPLATFSGGLEGFMIETFHDTSQTNLGDPMSGASPPPMLSVDTDVGNPEAPSLRLTAPYSGARQYVDIQRVLGTTNIQNWSGRTLRVRVRLTEGTSTGGIQLYVKTTSAYVFGGSFTNFAMGSSSWQEFMLDIDNPTTRITGYDPSQVISFGLQLNSGDGGAGSRPVTFHIDSFSINPPLTTSDGGAGADAAADRGAAADATGGDGAAADAAGDGAAAETDGAAADGAGG